MAGDRAKIGEAYVEIKATDAGASKTLEQVEQATKRTSAGFTGLVEGMRGALLQVRRVVGAFTGWISTAFALVGVIATLVAALGTFVGKSKEAERAARDAREEWDRVIAQGKRFDESIRDRDFSRSQKQLQGAEAQLEAEKEAINVRLRAKDMTHAQAAEERALAIERYNSRVQDIESDRRARNRLAEQLKGYRDEADLIKSLDADVARSEQEADEDRKQRNAERFAESKRRHDEEARMARESMELVKRQHAELAESVRDLAQAQTAAANSLRDGLAVSMTRLVELAEQIKTRMPR